jgi:hypothetical protein
MGKLSLASIHLHIIVIKTGLELTKVDGLIGFRAFPVQFRVLDHFYLVPYQTNWFRIGTSQFSMELALKHQTGWFDMDLDGLVECRTMQLGTTKTYFFKTIN